ncbi:Acyl-CoA dehydrogenase [Pseudonocardia ammonioxydans]|uniref:Acyl-CoA dehydrogenase n=1 Tax=Pseudonocardia ammonioxydans TaxID=260086 RepID=A0A1I4YF82_PSUAM|nr:acyl-CoA dehydrogenase family protein [Pseudonocardia ammonioxydans]SFN36721.1 Acyl-CoA dehydrogenase [Pseudonocardia ammonioxydans]
MTSTLTTPPQAGGRPAAEELYARAEALVPVLRERARTAEGMRRIPDETIADLEAAGLFYVVSPQSEGGYGHSMRELGTITRILAKGCASTAWVYSFLVVHNVSITQDLKQLLNGRPFATAALSAGFQATPSGTAVPVEGGWRVTGKWPFASGIMNADHVLFVTLEERPGDEEPAVLGLCADVADVELIDIWHMAGMQATGSNTFALDDHFIPADRRWTAFGQERLTPADPNDVRPLEGFSIIRMFDVLLSAVAVGCAEAAVEDMHARIQTRIVGFGLGPQREHPEAWGRYGQALTEARMARTLWDETLRIVTDLSDRGEAADVETAAKLRMASPRICQVARDAIQIVVEGSGSSIFHLDNPLQRQQRDVNFLKNHSYLHPDGAFVPAGAALLGLADPVDGLLLI